MSAIPIEVYLSLEESLSQRLRDTAGYLLESFWQSIQDFMDREEWDKASTTVQQLDLNEVYDLNEDYIRYISYVAMLFGASRLNSNPQLSVVGFGFENHTVEACLSAFRQMISVGGVQSLQKRALQLIALKQNPATLSAKDMGLYLGAVLKGEKKSAVLPFASFMQTEGRSYFNMASSLHTSRLSAFGYTAEAKALGITHYTINEQLDGRVCAVCAFMHGKTFAVEDARGLLDITIRTQDPQELKYLQPWPSQSSAGLKFLQGLNEEQLVQQGWHVPPFHPRCRGLLVKAGSAPALEAGGSKPAPQKESYSASAEDFHQLGLKMSPTKIDLWNELIQTAPVEVVSRLTMKPLADALAALQQDKSPSDALGLSALKVGKTGVNLQLASLLAGSSKPVLQDLYFRIDKSLFVGSVEFDAADATAKRFAQVLRNLYGVANDVGMTRITAVAGADSGGFAFAKYGFAPSPSQWAALKAQIKALSGKGALAKLMSPSDIKALDAILASDDPKMVFALADIPQLGKAVLAGTTWTGSLDFADEESMKRFFTYLK